jgi:hypothetical protein
MTIRGYWLSAHNRIPRAQSEAPICNPVIYRQSQLEHPALGVFLCPICQCGLRPKYMVERSTVQVTACVNDHHILVDTAL